jgi:hypothetical protein
VGTLAAVATALQSNKTVTALRLRGCNVSGSKGLAALAKCVGASNYLSTLALDYNVDPPLSTAASVAREDMLSEFGSAVPSYMLDLNDDDTSSGSSSSSTKDSKQQQQQSVAGVGKNLTPYTLLLASSCASSLRFLSLQGNALDDRAVTQIFRALADGCKCIQAVNLSHI